MQQYKKSLHIIVKRLYNSEVMKQKYLDKIAAKFQIRTERSFLNSKTLQSYRSSCKKIIEIVEYKYIYVISQNNNFTKIYS